MQMPNSKELVMINQAYQIMKKNNEKVDKLEMMLMISYPECQHELLNFVYQTITQQINWLFITVLTKVNQFKCSLNV